MSAFVSVLRALCGSVVKIPFPFALLYRSHPHPAHYMPALCSNVIHPSRHIGHQNHPFRPSLPPPSLFAPTKSMYMQFSML